MEGGGLKNGNAGRNIFVSAVSDGHIMGPNGSIIFVECNPKCPLDGACAGMLPLVANSNVKNC